MPKKKYLKEICDKAKPTLTAKNGNRGINLKNKTLKEMVLEKVYDIPFSEGTLHEFVISAKSQKNRGVKAIDIAK